MNNFQSLSFSLNLEQDSLTKLRFLYPQSGYGSHDSVALQSISLLNSEQKNSSFLYFDRVNGKDLDNRIATAANDYGLYLNSGVTGANPSNDVAFEYNLDHDNLIIEGSELSKFTENISFNIELHEINKYDGSVQIHFQGWMEQLGEWKDIGTISTTDKKEYNADWQQLTDSPNSNPPIIGYDDNIPIPTPPLNDANILEIKQPENEKNVGDFISDETVLWSLDGDDSGLFEINTDGYLKFKTAPDYENPSDNGNDNNYDLDVFATNTNSESTIQKVAIEVSDVSECEIIIGNEGTNNEVLTYASDSSCLDESIWLSISLTGSLTGELTNNDWVGVNILNNEGVVLGLNGLGHAYTNNNQTTLSDNPLLVELEANESLKLTRLNPPQLGGEVAETVNINAVGPSSFEAILGNNLVLKIDELSEDPTSWEIDQVKVENSPAEGIFDSSELSRINSQELSVNISGDSGFINTIGVVKLDQSINGYSINGVLSDEGSKFLEEVESNIQGFDGVLPSLGGGVYEQEFDWTLDAQGTYALVMISQEGEVYTFGTNTSADGKQHIKELGSFSWGFEDLSASQNPDWDYNDVIVTISQA